jgi:hypothetical protein
LIFKGPLGILFILDVLYLDLQALIDLLVYEHVKTVVALPRHQPFFLRQVFYHCRAVALYFQQLFHKVLSLLFELLALISKVLKVSQLDVLIVVTGKGSFVCSQLVFKVFFHFEED